jgi:hypothetical protein
MVERRFLKPLDGIRKYSIREDTLVEDVFKDSTMFCRSGLRNVFVCRKYSKRMVSVNGVRLYVVAAHHWVGDGIGERDVHEPTM